MMLCQQLPPLPPLGRGAHQLPVKWTIRIKCSVHCAHGRSAELDRLGSGHFQVDARRRSLRQNDPTPALQLGQNRQCRSGLPAPVGRAPLPPLAQGPGQSPATRSALLRHELLHGLNVLESDRSSTNHPRLLYLRPSAIQLLLSNYWHGRKSASGKCRCSVKCVPFVPALIRIFGTTFHFTNDSFNGTNYSSRSQVFTETLVGEDK